MEAAILTRRASLALGASATASVLARPARAATRLRVLTYFFAEPSQGGLWQAAATGLYEKAGLDVELRQGGPQLNGLQLLAGGDVDIFMAASIAVLSGVDRGVPMVAIAAPLQFDLQCLVARQDVPDIEAMKTHKILVTAAGQSGYWLWLKRRYGFTDDQLGPYTGNLQPFAQDPNLVVGGIATTEPYLARQTGIDVKYFLLAKYGYPPYGAPLTAMRSTLEKDPDAITRFLRATMEGWKSFLTDPTPGLNLIKQTNPRMSDGWIAYSLATLKELGVVTGGDAATQGIGIMNADRWRALADLMVQVNLVKPGIDWQTGFTNDYVKDLRITL